MPIRYNGQDNQILTDNYIPRCVKIDSQTIYGEDLIYPSPQEYNTDYTLTYTDVEGGVEVSGGELVNFNTQITIPSTYEGKTVIGIGDSAFNAKTNLASVIFPNTITYIGANAFASCSWLDNVIIPSSVQQIKDQAFNTCERLVHLQIKEGVESIGNGAFTGAAITEIRLPDSVQSVGSVAFGTCHELKEIHFSKNTQFIGEWVLFDCRKLETLEVPFIGETADSSAEDEKTVLGHLFGGASVLDGLYQCYQNCGNNSSLTSYPPLSLKNIIISGNNTHVLAAYAISNFSSLEEVTIGNNITTISDSCFRWCTNLSKIHIRDRNGTSLNFNGLNIFTQCPAFTDVYYQGSIESWANDIVCELINSSPIASKEGVSLYVLDGKKVEGEIILQMVQPRSRIQRFAFYSCTGITKITVLGVRMGNVIGGQAFDNISSLTSLTISGGTINNALFMNNIPNNISTIYLGAIDTTASPDFSRLTENTTIYCVYPTKPPVWADNWAGQAHVVWGVVGIYDNQNNIGNEAELKITWSSQLNNSQYKQAIPFIKEDNTNIVTYYDGYNTFFPTEPIKTNLFLNGQEILIAPKGTRPICKVNTQRISKEVAGQYYLIKFSDGSVRLTTNDVEYTAAPEGELVCEAWEDVKYIIFELQGAGAGGSGGSAVLAGVGGGAGSYILGLLKIEHEAHPAGYWKQNSLPIKIAAGTVGSSNRGKAADADYSGFYGSDDVCLKANGGIGADGGDAGGSPVPTINGMEDIFHAFTASSSGSGSIGTASASIGAYTSPILALEEGWNLLSYPEYSTYADVSGGGGCTHFGEGGSGKAFTGTNGEDGKAPGTGGAGGTSKAFGSTTGGAGRDGLLRLYY